MATVFVLWYGFFRKPPSPRGTVSPTAVKVVEIDFAVLENPILEQLKPFEGVTPFDGEAGRENPFIPYQK